MTMVWQPAQLFLDVEQMLAWIRGSASQQEGKNRSEPADSSGNVNLRERIFAAVSFDVQQQFRAAGPIETSFHQCGEESVIDLRVVGCRHVLKQRPGLLQTQRYRNGLRGRYVIWSNVMVYG